MTKVKKMISIFLGVSGLSNTARPININWLSGDIYGTMLVIADRVTIEYDIVLTLEEPRVYEFCTSRPLNKHL